MSNSVRSHRQQPTRLPRPWDFPGKNTGVGCHFLLQCMKVKSKSEVAQSCPTLSDPMDSSLPGSSTHWIFQARVLEWGAIAFSKTPTAQRSNSQTAAYRPMRWGWAPNPQILLESAVTKCFIVTIRCCLPLSLCWHWHQWCKSNGE